MKQETLLTEKLLLFFALLMLGFGPSTFQAYASETDAHLRSKIDIEVTGNVTSDEGEPLIGATILVKGTSVGTVTDFEGNYSIEAPEDGILVFSYTGYESKEIDVNGQAVINVSLTSDIAELSEVVVVGYGSQKKENLTGSVGVVGAETIEARPITSTSQALQGQVPGVWINQNSGEPGQDGATIRIRGIGTLNNSNPLVLVDGIEAPIDNINPNDIESITVLKDAASAAIYGSRAANGVVLVTTKTGDINSRPTFNYTGTYGIQEATNVPDYVWDSRTFMDLRNEADINSGRNPLYPQDVVERYDQLNFNTNWFDEIFRSAPIQQHNLTVSGGGGRTNFLLSAGYQDQDAIVENTVGSQRFNGRLNLDTRITDNFKIGTRLAFSQQNSNLDNIGQDGGVLARATRLGPNFPAFDDQGRFAQRASDIDAIELSTPNILAEVKSLNRRLQEDRLLGNFYAEWEVIPGLKVRGTVAANYRIDNDEFFNRRVDMYDWETGDLSLSWSENRRLENTYEERINLTSWLQATYEKSFGVNNFTVLVGANQESFKREFFGAARIELPTNSLPVLDFGNAGTATNYGGASEWALRSFFGRLNYDFDGKYLFEFNIRRDGSSRFGSNNRWATFPSVSAGWVLSRENFLAGSDFIDFLKIRASWGQLGNQLIGDYPFAAGIAFDPAYNYNGTIVGAAAQTTLGNPDIRWETTTQTDIGVNLGVFDGKLSIEADYFIRNTEDILFDQQNPGVTGVRTPTTLNIAEVENRGWEASLSYSENIGDFGFSVGGNVTNVESEVVSVNPNVSAENDRVIQGNYIIQRGQPINALFGLRAIGIFQSQAEIDAAADQSAFITPGPGDLQYEDINGDGVINNDDRTVLGQENPSWIFGFNLTMNYKGFDVRALLQGIADVQTYETGRIYAPFNNSGGVSTIWLEDRWTPENPSTVLPKLYVSSENGVNHNVPHSWWITERDYLRLKNLQIGYTIPTNAFGNSFIESLRIFANGQNLFTITDYVGFDPERAERDTNAGSGYPQLQIYTFGVNLRF